MVPDARCPCPGATRFRSARPGARVQLPGIASGGRRIHRSPLPGMKRRAVPVAVVVRVPMRVKEFHISVYRRAGRNVVGLSPIIGAAAGVVPELARGRPGIVDKERSRGRVVAEARQRVSTTPDRVRAPLDRAPGVNRRHDFVPAPVRGLIVVPPGPGGAVEVGARDHIGQPGQDVRPPVEPVIVSVFIDQASSSWALGTL